MREYWWSGEKVEEILRAVSSGSSCMKAKSFESHACNELKKLGYDVSRQVLVSDRGDGRRGFVDVVASKGTTKAAIELDHVHPRKKSIYKVKQIPNATFKLVFCRAHFKQ